MSDRSVLTRQVTTHSPEETREVGARLGGAAEAGDVFLLSGEFGAGKTVLVQGLAAGLGVETFVASPSFVLINQHQGRLTLHHIDLYRIEQLDPELEDTVADAIDAGGLTAIEWPQLLPDDLRNGATTIRITRISDDERQVVVETLHRRLADALDGTSRSQ